MNCFPVQCLNYTNWKNNICLGHNSNKYLYTEYQFSHFEIFYDKTKKRPFNTDDCLIEVTIWVGLIVYKFNT